MREISVTSNFLGYFSRTFEDLKRQFPGLFRAKVIFQDSPGPGILKKKIQHFPGGMGTLIIGGLRAMIIFTNIFQGVITVTRYGYQTPQTLNTSYQSPSKMHRMLWT